MPIVLCELEGKIVSRRPRYTGGPFRQGMKAMTEAEWLTALARSRCLSFAGEVAEGDELRGNSMISKRNRTRLGIGCIVATLTCLLTLHLTLGSLVWRTDTSIRNELLHATSVGSSVALVRGYADSHFAPNSVKWSESKDGGKLIAHYGSYPWWYGFPQFRREVWVTWHFDKDRKLIGVSIQREDYGV